MNKTEKNRFVDSDLMELNTYKRINPADRMKTSKNVCSIFYHLMMPAAKLFNRAEKRQILIWRE